MSDDNTLDLLLGRILDRRAAPADWDAFATLAQSRPESWGQLLMALRSEQGLLRGAEPALAVADRIELPNHTPALATSYGAADTAASAAPVPSMAAVRSRRPWAGWAAASVLALAWVGSSLLPADGAAHGTVGGPAAGAVSDAGPVASAPHAVPEVQDVPPAAPGPRLRDPSATAATAEDDLHGDIVGQLPLQLVSSVASADGTGLDVVFVRPVLERARVSGMYSLGLDDAGRPAPVSIKPASLLLADN